MQIKKIVVFAPNKPFFGASLVQFPFYQHLRKNYPQAWIILFSPVPETQLFLDYNLADELVVYPKSTFKNFWSLIGKVNTCNADVIISCREHSEQINFIVAMARAKMKIGFRPGPFTRPFYTKTVFYDTSLYRGSNFLNLVYLLDPPHKFGYEEIKLLQKNSTIEFDTTVPNICLIPGGGEGEHKRWGIDNFLGLCVKFLAIKKCKFVFILGFKEEEYIEPIRKALPEQAVHILFKVKIGDMVKAIENSKVVVANDCGPSHLAQMCMARYISVWGWENQQPYERIREWFLPHPHAVYVVAEEGKGIKTIAPETVLPHLVKLEED
jgi:ADP-heptose:LPS heptosyltransferase